MCLCVCDKKVALCTDCLFTRMCAKFFPYINERFKTFFVKIKYTTRGCTAKSFHKWQTIISYFINLLMRWSVELGHRCVFVLFCLLLISIDLNLIFSSLYISVLMCICLLKKLGENVNNFSVI